MCQDPPGRRLQRFALCCCGQDFPLCDLEEAKDHATSEWAVNHHWLFIHEDWINLLPVRKRTSHKIVGDTVVVSDVPDRYLNGTNCNDVHD